jgi:hypothetical protein
MTSGSAIRLSAGCSWIAIRHDELRLTRRFRARLPGIDHLRSPVRAHAAIGRQEEPGCSKGHAL